MSNALLRFAVTTCSLRWTPRTPSPSVTLPALWEMPEFWPRWTPTSKTTFWRCLNKRTSSNSPASRYNRTSSYKLDNAVFLAFCVVSCHDTKSSFECFSGCLYERAHTSQPVRYTRMKWLISISRQFPILVPLCFCSKLTSGGGLLG